MVPRRSPTSFGEGRRVKGLRRYSQEPRSYVGMTGLPKPTELARAISSQLKTLCEVNYAASILKHIIRNTTPLPLCGKMSLEHFY